MTTLHEPVFKVLSDEIFTDREDILATLKRIAYGAKRRKNGNSMIFSNQSRDLPKAGTIMDFCGF